MLIFVNPNLIQTIHIEIYFGTHDGLAVASQKLKSTFDYFSQVVERDDQLGWKTFYTKVC